MKWNQIPLPQEFNYAGEWITAGAKSLIEDRVGTLRIGRDDSPPRIFLVLWETDQQHMCMGKLNKAEKETLPSCSHFCFAGLLWSIIAL